MTTPPSYISSKLGSESNSNADDTDPDSDFKSEDFLLVMQSPAQASMMVENAKILCVDGTHGLTGYGYQLLSIVVVDKYGHGLVCAWGLASRENKYMAIIGGIFTTSHQGN